MSLYVPDYPDFESAQAASKRKRAVSARAIGPIPIVGVGMKRNRAVLIDIVLEVGQEPYGVYHSAVGIRIPFTAFRPTTAQIDGVKKWRAG